MKPERKKHLKNEKGMAVIEAIPLLVIFIMLMSYGMGFFGAIHTATLNSIAARTYAFETFRQRTNLAYFRENESGLTEPMEYKTKGFRFHGVSHETDMRPKFVATTRPMSIGRYVASEEGEETHNNKIFSLDRRNQKIGVNPIWVMVGYGICMDSQCGR